MNREKVSLLKPTSGQLSFLDWEFGVFFHFGIRSVYPGHKDWDGREMPPSGFDPDSLDPDEWVRLAKEAGATYTILTAKHHDGFALWPSAYSRYSVADTPWRSGRGDIIREYVAACRKYGMKIGLYYSPAQWGPAAVKFSEAKEYDEYFIHQITELLTNYGRIDYLWFDGCGSEGHEYDRERIVREIFRLQPHILTFCDPEWTPCIRWAGNEDGYASLVNPLVVGKTDFSELATEEQALSRAALLPSECDCKIRDTWFWDLNAETLKSTEELFGMYEMSVGHGSNFLLNIGPDCHGRIDDADARRLLSLGERIRRVYGNPIPFRPFEKTGENVYTVVRDGEGRGPLVNRVAIMEDLTEGQRITGFKLYAYLPCYTKKRICVYIGETVGHKLICPFGAIRTGKLELEITASEGTPKLRDIKAYYAE